MVFEGSPMVTQKDRRHSGYVTPRATVSKSDLIDNGLVIDPVYDDWLDYRDGFRDWFRDYKRIKNAKNKNRHHLFQKRLRMNQKQKVLLQRRKVKLLKKRTRQLII